MYDKPKFNEKYLGLPDFITMTNLVQGRGYFINIIINEGKFVGTITHKGRTQVTNKSFNKSLKSRWGQTKHSVLWVTLQVAVAGFSVRKDISPTNWPSFNSATFLLSTVTSTVPL